jgi:hypothetical protein
VERTFSWLGKCRRLAVDYERKPEHHQAWVQWAMVRVMVKRLARQSPSRPCERPAWPHDVIRTGSSYRRALNSGPDQGNAPRGRRRSRHCG